MPYPPGEKHHGLGIDRVGLESNLIEQGGQKIKRELEVLGVPRR